MAFKFKRNETIAEGFKRIAGEQLERAIEEIDDAQLERERKIHQVRKRCKKLRGALRLLRPALGSTYKIENVSLRDTARLLSDFRDASISLQTFMSLREEADEGDQQPFQRISQRLQQDQHEQSGDPQVVDEALLAVRERLVATVQRVGQWAVEREGFEALAGGWKRTYRQARRTLRRAQEQRTAESLHRWRKSVKYHGYQCRLLAAVWPVMLKARSGEAAQLGDWLGVDHDLAVLGQQVLEQPLAYGGAEPIDRLLGLIDQRRQELQDRSFRLGKKLFAEDKTSFVRRYQHYWKVWQKG